MPRTLMSRSPTCRSRASPPRTRGSSHGSLKRSGKYTERPARPVVQWAASDARYLRREGFPVVEYGPGEIHLLHAVDEYVTVESLENAARVYKGMLERYAGEEKR